jgi:hypothetical protein
MAIAMKITCRHSAVLLYWSSRKRKRREVSTLEANQRRIAIVYTCSRSMHK